MLRWPFTPGAGSKCGIEQHEPPALDRTGITPSQLRKDGSMAIHSTISARICLKSLSPMTSNPYFNANDIRETKPPYGSRRYQALPHRSLPINCLVTGRPGAILFLVTLEKENPMAAKKKTVKKKATKKKAAKK
jgi:hypothetical protein